MAEGREADHTRVRDVMTTQPHVCHPDDDVEEALNVMERYQVRRMPVVDVTDRLVGIISQADVAIRATELGKAAEVLERVSAPRAGI